MHEASLYEDNCFITLTFCDGSPYPGCNHEIVPLKDRVSLNKSYFPLFMKRLRKRFPGPRIKFYHAGEYGDHGARPHHHACLFNFNFPDRELYKKKITGSLYRSPTLEKLWPFGYSSIGEVTFESAAYVARYVMKKINGEMAPAHYQGRVPEYTTMSRGGRTGKGLGYDWFKKFKDSDIELAYRLGSITMNGKTYKIPKYYDTNFEITNPAELARIKEERLQKAKENLDNLPERLMAREAVHRARYDRMKKRNLG